jgi:hypothetical protein
MFLPLMEMAFGVFVIVVIVTQIMIPLFRGTPIFPVLQKHGIEAKLAGAKQELRIVELEKTLVEIRSKVTEERKKEGQGEE